MANKFKEWLDKHKLITINIGKFKDSVSTISNTKMFDSSYKLVNGIDEAFVEDSTKGVGDPYASHPYVNIAVGKIATNVNRAEFKVMSADNQVTTGPIHDLFTNVNSYMSRYQLWEATVSWLMIKGEAIWSFENGFTGLRAPKEIYVNDPHCWKHGLNKEKTEIVVWVYTNPETSQETSYMPNEIIHFKSWNPWNQFRGINPLIAQSNLLLQDSMIDESNVKLLDNNSAPAGILSSDQPLSPVQIDTAKDRWEKQHKGSANKGKLSVLPLGLKYQVIGLTPDEMSYFDSKKWNRSAILAKYGVPPVVAGYKDENTPLSGSDTNEQLTQFWNQTLIPIIRSLEDKLATDFTNKWTPTLTYKFDTDDIPELQENEADSSERLINLVGVGILTINEARERLDLEPLAQDQAEPLNEDEDVKNQLYLFDKWSVDDRVLECKKVTDVTTKFVEGIKKNIHDVLFKQRSYLLEMKSKNNLTLFNGLNDYWVSERKSLVQSLSVDLSEIGESVIETLPDSIENKEFDIDHEYIERKAEGLASFLDELRDTYKLDKQEIKEMYNTIKHNMFEFVYLEVLEMVNTFRMKIFEINGYLRHEYVKMKDFDLTDGDVTSIGWPFRNGKSVPSAAFTLPINKGDENE